MFDETHGEEATHELRNIKAQNAALKKLFGRAADELQELAESNADEEARSKAIAYANRLRTIMSDDQSS